MDYYVDVEFDGHGGPMLSIALIGENGSSIYITTSDVEPKNPWVLDHVVPYLDHDLVPGEVVKCISPYIWVGLGVREFLSGDDHPVFISDSPQDVMYLAGIISTDIDGLWCENPFSHVDFKVVNIESYPTEIIGAIQHNSWWDAIALKSKLNSLDIS